VDVAINTFFRAERLRNAEVAAPLRVLGIWDRRIAVHEHALVQRRAGMAAKVEEQPVHSVVAGESEKEECENARRL